MRCEFISQSFQGYFESKLAVVYNRVEIGNNHFFSQGIILN